jgi:hypothetical protein
MQRFVARPRDQQVTRKATLERGTQPQSPIHAEVCPRIWTEQAFRACGQKWPWQAKGQVSTSCGVCGGAREKRPRGKETMNDMRTWSPQFITEFIEMYKSCQCLYDIKSVMVLSTDNPTTFVCKS